MHRNLEHLADFSLALWIGADPLGYVLIDALADHVHSTDQVNCVACPVRRAVRGSGHYFFPDRLQSIVLNMIDDDEHEGQEATKHVDSTIDLDVNKHIVNALINLMFFARCDCFEF